MDAKAFNCLGCPPVPFPPPESDSRVGKLQGTHREHSPELTARALLKIVLSGTVVSYSLERRGEPESVTQGRCLHLQALCSPFPLSPSRSAWGFTAQCQQERASLQGELTLQAAHREGVGELGWRSEDWPLGSEALGSHLTHV